MGARLHYAKVIDSKRFYELGAKVHPGLDNEVVLAGGPPGVAGAFLILRAWGDDHGSFTEEWRIEAPGGEIVYQSLPRELHLAAREHVERLEDELADIEFDYEGDHHCVFTLDENEVARVRFPVRLESAPS